MTTTVNFRGTRYIIESEPKDGEFVVTDIRPRPETITEIICILALAELALREEPVN